MALEVHIVKKLHGFTLRVDFCTEGSNMGILGASGSGKSMTLRCIAGIETPDEGRIIINGRTLFDSEKQINLKPQERRVGYLFQNYALFPKMTVETLPVDSVEISPGRSKKFRIIWNVISLQDWKRDIPLSFPEDSSRESPWQG